MLSFVARTGSCRGNATLRAVLREDWTRLRPRHADALALLRCPVLRRTLKNGNAGHQTFREESVMKCSNPHCNRGIGLVAHRRGWFDKRRYCSKECRDTFVAQRPKISQQERSVMTYVEWLFLQPVENPRSQSRPAKRWEICYSTRSDARRDLVYLGGGRADFLTTR